MPKSIVIIKFLCDNYLYCLCKSKVISAWSNYLWWWLKKMSLTRDQNLWHVVKHYDFTLISDERTTRSDSFMCCWFSSCLYCVCTKHSLKSTVVLLFLNTIFAKSRSSRPEVFLGKGVPKICSKFTGEHPYRRFLIGLSIHLVFEHI